MFRIVIGITFIVLGGTGAFVLKGTNSPEALMGFGAFMILMGLVFPDTNSISSARIAQLEVDEPESKRRRSVLRAMRRLAIIRGCCFVTLLACFPMAFVGLCAKSQKGLLVFGIPAALMFVIPFVVSSIVWRCPRCSTSLMGRLSPPWCRYCGARFQ